MKTASSAQPALPPSQLFDDVIIVEIAGVYSVTDAAETTFAFLSLDTTEGLVAVFRIFC